MLISNGWFEKKLKEFGYFDLFKMSYCELVFKRRIDAKKI